MRRTGADGFYCRTMRIYREEPVRDPLQALG